jgi:hypothetical protein
VSPWLQSSFCNNSACVQVSEMEFNSASASNPSGACVQVACGEFIKAQASSMNGGCVEVAQAKFIKSDRSDRENCVEAAQAEFGQAKASSGGNSVEAARHQGRIFFVRDSKDPRSCPGSSDFDHLHYTYEEWNGGRAVQFAQISILDVPQDVVDARIAKVGHSTGAWYKVNHGDEPVTLYFDQAEKDAWKDGVENGEFNFELTTV